MVILLSLKSRCKKTSKKKLIEDIDTKIAELTDKRKSAISEIKFQVFGFKKYYENINTMDKLGLLHGLAIGLTEKNLLEFETRFREILAYEDEIRSLNAEKDRISGKTWMLYND